MSQQLLGPFYIHPKWSPEIGVGAPIFRKSDGDSSERLVCHLNGKDNEDERAEIVYLLNKGTHLDATLEALKAAHEVMCLNGWGEDRGTVQQKNAWVKVCDALDSALGY